MNTMHARKQALVAESELNRTQMIQELTVFKEEVRRLSCHVHTVTSAAQSLARVAGWFSFLRPKPHGGNGESGAARSSWMQSALKGARTGVSLWLMLRQLKRKA